MAEQVKGGRSLWGGHFASDPAPLMTQINASIGFDKRLYAQDIAGSHGACANARGRGDHHRAERDAILGGLEQVRGEIERGELELTTELEDIHLNIEHRLTDLVGEAGRRLHTARSRNDQVATDLKLWTRDAMDRADALLRRAAARAPGAGARACRHGDAGVHPFAGRAAGHASAIICWPMSRCWAATVRASPTRAGGSTSARSARRRWPARASHSTGP